MTEYRVGIAHVPYQIRGGEDSHVELLHRAYRSLGVDTVEIPGEGADSTALAGAWKGLRGGLESEWDELARGHNLDFLHLNNIHPLLGPSFLRWIVQREIPAVMTVHNHRFYCTNGLALHQGRVCKDCRPAFSLSRPLLRNCNGSYAKTSYHTLALKEIRGESLLARAVKLFLAPSAYIAGELEASGIPASRIRLVPHAVDVSSAGAPTEELASDIAFVGRLSPEKGFTQLLAAVNRMPGKRFAVVGQGPLDEVAREAAAAYPNLRWHGSVGRSEALAILRSARVACVPSVCMESFSLISAEALSLGVNLVVPDTEAFHHFTAPPVGAISANVHDPKQLCEALERALALPRPTQARVAELAAPYSVDTFRKRLLEILQEAVR